jgi:hypothetical protein
MNVLSAVFCSDSVDVAKESEEKTVCMKGGQCRAQEKTALNRRGERKAVAL